MKLGLCALNAKYVHTNLALRYFLHSFKNFDMELCEYTINDNLRHISKEISSKEFDVVLFSCYIWNIEHIIKISEILKKSNEKLIIILGGPEVSFESVNLMQRYPFIDYIVMGEGEANLDKVIAKINTNDRDFSEVKGLTWQGNGEIHINSGYPVLKDLDLLPFPYTDEELLIRNRIFYYETIRGCPYSCSYCLSSTIKGVRTVSIEKVKKDLKKFIDMNVPLVKFIDRTANYSKTRFIEILEFIKENSINTKFHFEIAAHILDTETLKIIKTMPKNLIQFEIGVQSTNTKTIESIDRNTDFIKIKSYVNELIKQANVDVHMDLIAGLPYEDFESFKNSFNDLYHLKPDCIQVGFLKVLKGSKIREEYLKYGIEYESFAPYEVIKTNYIDFDEINKLKTIDFLVDKYYNSRCFVNSLNYINKLYTATPFDLFYDFAIYFEENYSISDKFSLDKIYDIIYDFTVNILLFDANIFGEILKFDYVKRVKPTFHPKWYKIDTEMVRILKKNEYKEFRNYERQIETFYIDILEAVNSDFNIITNEKTNILFEYKTKNIKKFKFA